MFYWKNTSIEDKPNTKNYCRIHHTALGTTIGCPQTFFWSSYHRQKSICSKMLTSTIIKSLLWSINVGFIGLHKIATFIIKGLPICHLEHQRSFKMIAKSSRSFILRKCLQRSIAPVLSILKRWRTWVCLW